MKTHPGTRLVLAVALAVEALLHANWQASLAALLAVEVPVALLLGVLPAFLRSAARLLGPMALSAALMTWAFSPHDGVAAAAVGLRLAAGLGSMVLLLVSTSLSDLASGLEDKGLPTTLAYTAVSACQLVPGMVQRAARVRTTLQARGADLESWSGRVRHLPALVVPVVVAELLAAERRATTLMARGFGLPGTVRTLWRPLPEQSWEPLVRYLIGLALLVQVTLHWRP